MIKKAGVKIEDDSIYCKKKNCLCLLFFVLFLGL